MLSLVVAFWAGATLGALTVALCRAAGPEPAVPEPVPVREGEEVARA